MSDRKSKKEKRISRALIFVAGAVCGLAVCVSVLMIFAASGAFVNDGGNDIYRRPQYTVDTDDVPEYPDPEVNPPPENAGRFEISCWGLEYSPATGKLDYRLYIRRVLSERMRITGISCAAYRGTECRRTVLISDGSVPGEEWWPYSARQISGIVDLSGTDFDTLVFTLKWEDESGGEYSAAVVAQLSDFGWD